MTSATWERSESRGVTAPSAAKAITLVVFWIIAIALWIVAPGVSYAPAGAFIIDTGIVLAALSFGLLFVDTLSGFYRGLVFAVVAILVFALADFSEWTPVVYTLRMLIPLLCLLMPLNRFLNNFRVFS